MPDLNERVASLETKSAETDRRLDKLETVTEAIHDLASGVKQMSTDVAEVKQDIKKVESKVSEIEQKPAKLSLKLWIYIGGLFCSGIVGAILALIGLGG